MNLLRKKEQDFQEVSTFKENKTSNASLVIDSKKALRNYVRNKIAVVPKVLLL